MRLIDADKLKQLRDDVISGKLDIQIEGDLIDACPTVNPYEWINVKDRLPKDNGKLQKFLVCRNQSSSTSGKVLIQTEFFTNAFNGKNNITYWMPLPTPPAEKEN